MIPELFLFISTIGAGISALCALFTVYIYRTQGKGFVWTKDQTLKAITDQAGGVHVQVSIPLFNLGKGNVQFISLKAKKVDLSSNAVENYEMDMDEAYFPEGVNIANYKSKIYSDMHGVGEKDQLIIFSGGASQGIADPLKLQDTINKKLQSVPEHIVILKCTYKDGSWFGLGIKNTVIGLSVTGLSISYLSKSRRKDLNKLFAL